MHEVCVCVCSWSDSKSDPTALDPLRKLEVDMNNAFDQYRELYYDGGISSVYLWETTDDVESFAGSVLFKKAGLGSQMIKGCWDSIHVFEVGKNPYDSDSISRFPLTKTRSATNSRRPLCFGCKLIRANVAY